MAKSSNQDASTGLVAAFQSVTDGVMDLAKTHLELAKAEARHDVKVYGTDATYAAAGFGLALLGFGILNIAFICLAGWLGGMAAMAATAGALGLIYIVVGRSIIVGAVHRMREREGAMAQTKNEIKRSTEWVKEIREIS